MPCGDRGNSSRYEPDNSNGKRKRAHARAHRVSERVQKDGRNARRASAWKGSGAPDSPAHGRHPGTTVAYRGQRAQPRGARKGKELRQRLIRLAINPRAARKGKAPPTPQGLPLRMRRRPWMPGRAASRESAAPRRATGRSPPREAARIGRGRERAAHAPARSRPSRSPPFSSPERSWHRPSVSRIAAAPAAREGRRIAPMRRNATSRRRRTSNDARAETSDARSAFVRTEEKVADRDSNTASSRSALRRARRSSAQWGCGSFVGDGACVSPTPPAASRIIPNGEAAIPPAIRNTQQSCN